MALRGLLRIGEVCIRVMDVAKSRRHYGEILGLHEVMQGADGKVYYKAWDEHDHHSIVLRPADRPGMDYFAFKVYDDATLTAIAALPSSVACECPRHVAELLMQLAGFEAYSAACASRGPADAALHAHLHQVAGRARALFESALERVAHHEGLSLPRMTEPSMTEPNTETP